MDVRIEGFYERMLLRLAQIHHEPTGKAMMRVLIKDAAREVGLWDSRFEILEDGEAHSLETEAE